MISAEERVTMLAVPTCGERVPMRLESIGIERLAHLRSRDPWDLMFEINLEAGREIWRPPIAIWSLQQLIDAAEREVKPSVRRTSGG